MAADLDLNPGGENFGVILVPTNAVKRVCFPAGSVVVAHLGVQDNAIPPTASDAADKLVIMACRDRAGNDLAMVADLADGKKNIVLASGATQFDGADIPAGPDGAHEIQLQAIGHPCKVQIVCNRLRKYL
jgi:hypothetical protein